MRGPEDRLALTREVGRLQMELTCMYTVASKYGLINKLEYFRLHLSYQVCSKSFIRKHIKRSLKIERRRQTRTKLDLSIY